MRANLYAVLIRHLKEKIKPTHSDNWGCRRFQTKPDISYRVRKFLFDAGAQTLLILAVLHDKLKHLSKFTSQAVNIKRLFARIGNGIFN